MVRCTIRFYEELNDYLPESLRKRDVTCCVREAIRVGDLVEGFGVPLDEVDLILVNGLSVDLSYEVTEGVRVSIYPIFESFDITGITRVRNRPLHFTRKKF